MIYEDYSKVKQGSVQLTSTVNYITPLQIEIC
jgi:hypothetical protein